MPLSRIGSRVRSRRKARSSQSSAGLVAMLAHRPTAAGRSSSGGRSSWARNTGSVEVVRDADALQERQVGGGEVARAPGQELVVDGDHDRPVAGALGPPHQALDHVAVARPVELEPARPVPARRRHLLDRPRGGSREHDRHAQRRGRAGRRQLALRVDDALHADGREQQRRGQVGAEQAHAQVARLDVAQHPRHQPPAPERLQVRAHGVLGPRAAGDVVVGLRRDAGAEALLPRRRSDRQLRGLAAQAGAIDLVLVLAEGPLRLRCAHAAAR